MSNRASYDTVAGIQERLTSLEALLGIVFDREAAAQRGENLREFLVLGAWHLTAGGHFGKARVTLNYRDSDLATHFQQVVDLTQLRESFQSLETSTSLNSRLPRSKDTCPHCSQGWTLETAHNVYNGLWQGEDQLAHPECRKIALAMKSRRYIDDLIQRAGFALYTMNEIPNGYYSTPVSEPWWVCQTPSFKITVGWRRHVINIDWSDSKVDLLSLFETEKVTKAPHYIHAWSPDKAVEYLTKIRKELGCP
jgi:hypothetical protein